MVWRERLDAALSPVTSRPLARLEPEALAALRIGAAQMLVLGTPAHAAVSATVGAVDRRIAPFVNAVLRRLSVEGEPEGLDPWVRLSHPRSLWERWSARWGTTRAARLMAFDNEVPPIGAAFPSAAAPGSPGRFLEEYRILDRKGSPDLDALHGGYIQDEAAAVVGRGAALLPGKVVLEACASPGGKTAWLDRTSDVVVSLDLSPGRLAPWLSNRDRLGWARSFPAAGDGAAPPVASVSKAVVDAPCTATGILRRRSDARWRWSGEHLAACVERQRRLLDGAASRVAPGGVLVYSVCSLEPEEGILQVEWFEAGHPGFRRIEFPAPPVLVRDGMLDIFPPDHGIDGHFAACWERLN